MMITNDAWTQNVQRNSKKKTISKNAMNEDVS